MDATGPRRRLSSFAPIAENQVLTSLSATPPPSPAATAATWASSRPPSPSWGPADRAAGGKKRITLSDPGLLQKLCCCMPGVIVFPLMLTIIVTALFARELFLWITAALTIWSAVYSSNLSIGCALGAWRMRRDVNIDWHAKLEALQAETPDSSAAMHIVFLPNYKEDEQMMQHTLENLARSALARKSMYVVLCMEDREGEAARQKAANLIDAARHHFADVFATFHPANLPGDMAGKSSNCQWAYKQVLQRLAPQLAKHDASQVFLTCCDADTLFHPQYFSAMTYQALTMPARDRAWSLWQPPILLMRNLFSSPAPTRVSGYATIIFELAGLSNQVFSPHFSFSTYSFTLAMASHPFVDGWDRDVIAEDHHMFCKCYFASIWEQLETVGAESGLQPSGAKGAASHMRLNPVYLPAISYLVESDDGWFASIHARFVQARRHSQGLAELSYVFLQHAHLLMSDARSHIAMSTHARVLSIAGKMASVHLIANLHSLAFILATVVMVLETAQWVLRQDPQVLLQTLTTRGVEGLLSLHSLGGLKWALFAIFGPIPPMGMLMSASTYLVVRDTLEGKLSRDIALPKQVAPTELAAPDVQGSITGPGGMTLWQQLQLWLMIQADYFGGAFITMLVYGLTPATMAAWSLLTENGTGFQYIVGIKPTEAA